MAMELWMRWCVVFRGLRIGERKSANEFITEPMNSEEILGAARVGFEFLPKQSHVNVHGASHWHRVVSPYFIQQLVAGECRFAVFDEISEQMVFSRGQLDHFVSARHLRTAKI